MTLRYDQPIDGRPLSDLSLANAQAYLTNLFPGTQWKYSHAVGFEAVFTCDNVTNPREQLGIVEMWTVYSSPQDFPGQWVARLFYNDQRTQSVLIANTYEALLEQLPPGLFRLERDPSDQSHIVETWI